LYDFMLSASDFTGTPAAIAERVQLTT
jgi:hypothetical protein